MFHVSAQPILESCKGSITGTTYAEGQSLLIKMCMRKVQLKPTQGLLWLGKFTTGIHTTVATDAQINISCLQRILGMLHTVIQCTHMIFESLNLHRVHKF